MAEEIGCLHYYSMTCKMVATVFVFLLGEELELYHLDMVERDKSVRNELNKYQVWRMVAWVALWLA